jgi:hypothetical protein
MMSGRTIKQCSFAGMHEPHGWLDGNGSAQWSSCDGITPRSMAEAGHISLEPLTDLARVYLDQMAPSIKARLIVSALEAGVELGDTFSCTMERGDVSKEQIEHERAVKVAFECHPDPEGQVRLVDNGTWVPTVVAVRPGHEAIVHEVAGRRYVYVAGIDYGGQTSSEFARTLQRNIDRMTKTKGEPTGEIPMETDLWHIINELLPEIDAHMRMGAAHYGYETHHDLGLRGQYADMYRKWAMLKRVMWDGEATVREGLREILMDMIGHLLLTICMLDKGEDSGVH